MPYFLSFLLLLCLSGVANAQSLAIELAGGPTMAYRISTAGERFKNSVDDEQPMLSYEAGVRMFYSLNENWRVGGGLLYARKGFFLEPFQGFAPTPVEQKAVVSFLELPFVARYNLKEKNKFRLYSQSGLGASFLLRERILLEDPISFNGYPVQAINRANTRKVNLAFHAGLGASYQLADGWQVGAEPAFTCQLLPMLPAGESNTSIRRRLFSLGLNLVASYTW